MKKKEVVKERMNERKMRLLPLNHTVLSDRVFVLLQI